MTYIFLIKNIIILKINVFNALLVFSLLKILLLLKTICSMISTIYPTC